MINIVRVAIGARAIDIDIACMFGDVTINDWSWSYAWVATVYVSILVLVTLIYFPLILLIFHNPRCRNLGILLCLEMDTVIHSWHHTIPCHIPSSQVANITNFGVMIKIMSLTHFSSSQADSQGAAVQQSSQSTTQYVIHSCPLVSRF